jgi:hypothetical protein
MSEAEDHRMLRPEYEGIQRGFVVVAESWLSERTVFSLYNIQFGKV